MTASFFSLLLMTQALFAMDFVVASLGAKGEGKTDDSPAIRKAAVAAVSTGGVRGRTLRENLPRRLE